MPHWKVDIPKLRTAVETVRRYRELTAKEIAEEMGVPASTLTRLKDGHKLDVDAFASMMAWLRADPSAFICRADGQVSEPESESESKVFLDRQDVLVAWSWAWEALASLPVERQPGKEARALVEGALRRIHDEVGAIPEDLLGTFSEPREATIHLHPRCATE